ncbi:MAG: hypothetical protein ACKN9S_13970 [Pirellula sp.]
MTSPIDPLHSPRSYRRLERYLEDRAIEGSTAPQSAGQRYGDGRESARQKPSVVSTEPEIDEPIEPLETKPSGEGTSVDYYA